VNLEQRRIVCICNRHVFRVTRPAHLTSQGYSWPLYCDACLPRDERRFADRPPGTVVDEIVYITSHDAALNRSRWGGRLSRLKQTSVYPRGVVPCLV
jgi:hypothetical protein